MGVFYLSKKRKIVSLFLVIIISVCLVASFFLLYKESRLETKVSLQQKNATYLMKRKMKKGETKQSINKSVEPNLSEKEANNKRSSIVEKEEKTDKNVKIDYQSENVHTLTEEAMNKVDSEQVVKKNGIGMLDISELGIHIPILEGYGHNSLAVGAGTMKPNQCLKKGNFSLAGHHMNNSLLFGNLKNARKGMEIVMKIGNESATYVISEIRYITALEGYVKDDTEGEKICTLVTCDDTGKGRLMVRGDLLK